MDRDAFVLVAVLPLLVEALVLWVRPTWLVLVPMWVVAERRFTLRRARRADQQTGYRDAVGTLPLPELPARLELDQSVLFAEGRRIALRRAFAFGRRESWLIRIDILREGDAVLLRARQSLSPITMVLVAPALAWGVGRGAVVPAIGFLAIMAAVLGVQMAVSAARRQEACVQAFDALEAELRRELEEPAPRRDARS